MKRYIAFILVGSIFVLSGQAQTKLWTMDRCMKYAIEHSTTVQKRIFEASNCKADYHAAVNSFFPKLAAEVSAQYNWGRNIDPSTNTYNTITTFNNYYNLYSSVYLFDGGQIINQFKQARINKMQGENEIQRARDDKAIEVMQAFIDAAYYRECISLAQDKLADSNQTLLKTNRQEELGIKGRPDVAQIKAQVAEDDYNLTHQQNLYNTALLTLKSAMSYPSSDSLTIDTLTHCTQPEFKIENAADVYLCALNGNPVAKSADYNIQKAKYQYNIMKGKILPSFSLTAGVATNYYKNFSGSDTTIPFKTQFKNNRGEYVGAVLSIPIFNGSTRSDIKKAKNNIQIAMLDRDETTRKLHTDIEQALLDCNGYVKEIRQMENKVNADSLAYYVVKRKFEEGMVSALDLHTSSNTLLQSRVTLLQKRMLYTIKSRLVDYYKGESLIKQ